MTETRDISGQCLCGAVTVQATVTAPTVRACHCDMCRRHTSSMFMSLKTDEGSIRLNGPAKSFVSSDWAERGFCETCGSTLWYGLRETGEINLAAGLFDNAGGAPLTTEFFSDMCPTGYALAGGHKRMTTDETIALFAPEED